MKHIRKEIFVHAAADRVWAAVRDVGAIHQRLARGFVVDTRLDGDSRLVTFKDGTTVRERILDVDDRARRLEYSIVGGRATHHCASIQVIADGDGGSRVIWNTDVQPDSLAGTFDAAMAQGCEAMKTTLERNPRGRVPMNRRRQIAWVLIVVADAGIAAWGFMAAALPDYLPGPGGKPILPAGFEGYSGAAWPALVASSPMTAGYLEILFRMYGVFNLIVGFMGIAIAATAFRRGDDWAWWTLLVANTMAFVSAMTYDRVVNAIGPFELSEYLGLALVYAALVMTARRRSTGSAIAAPG